MVRPPLGDRTYQESPVPVLRPDSVTTAETMQADGPTVKRSIRTTWTLEPTLLGIPARSRSPFSEGCFVKLPTGWSGRPLRRGRRWPPDLRLRSSRGLTARYRMVARECDPCCRAAI